MSVRTEPRCRVKIVNVGLVTDSVMPKPRAKPWTKVVLPAPRSPWSASVLSGGSAVANFAAKARVSSAEAVVTPPRSWSKMFIALICLELERIDWKIFRLGEGANAGEAGARESSSPGFFKCGLVGAGGH